MQKGKGLVILMIGQRDAGKTTATKKLIGTINKEKHFFDFRGEYGFSLPTFDDYIQQALSKRDTLMVIEEATVFLSNRGDDRRVKNLLAGASHHGNIIVILYHSLRSIPTYIFDLTDYYYLFKTKDKPKLVETKFDGMDELIQDYHSVREAQDSHFHVVRKNDL